MHPFWGNWNRVARCFCAVDREGFKDGLVELADAVRNDSTGMVYGFESLDGRRIVEDDLSSCQTSPLNMSRQGQMVAAVASPASII
jgi:hypothetical protein